MISFESMLTRVQEKNEEFFKQLLSKHEIKRVGSSFRIQPCPFCGHNDCMTVDTKKPIGHCFSCGFKGTLWTITKEVLGTTAKAKVFIEDFIGDKFYFQGKSPDEKEQRIFKIRMIYAQRCNEELINDKKYLEYQTEKRKHKKTSVESFLIGKAINYSSIHDELIDEGFTEEEIQEAKIYIPEGLVVYPYFNSCGEIVRFNTKNPFGIEGKDGEVIRGFSTGTKDFYRSNKVSKEEVVITEGENDLITIVEAGYNSVLATGGQMSDKQIEYLKTFKRIYTCFDNDEAGEKHTKKLNDSLPELEVFKVVYNEKYKDIDEYLKSDDKIDINQLIKNAVKLDNENYSIQIRTDELILTNRNYQVIAKAIDKKDGRYKIDFKYYAQGKLEYIKQNVFLDNINKKYIQFIEPINDSFEHYFNEDLQKRDIYELLNIRRFSNKNEEIIKIVADKIVKTGYNETEVDEFLSNFGPFIRDKVLQEINLRKNSLADPNKIYEPIILAQSFDLEKKIGYMYFNLIKVNENNVIREIPALLSSDKRIIRLDLIKRKDKQQLLLIDNSFRLPYEIETKIMDSETLSLSNKYVEMFINNELDDEQLSISNLVKKLEENYSRVLYTDDEKVYKLLAIYTMSTYYYMVFGEIGYLFLNGEKGNGKSLICKLLETFCFCPKYTVASSEAALFRSISFEGGTFILDELENLGSRGRANDSVMGQILKAGYSKDGGKTMRMNMETGAVEGFTLYGPKIIANIFGLEDVIGDRCIPLNVKKYSSKLTQTKENIKVFLQKNKEENKRLTSLCCISALMNFTEVFNIYSTYKLESVSARSTQILRPLFVIAHLAGEEYERAMFEYYEEYILLDKKWVETTTPEGIIREIASIIAEEIYNETYKYLTEEFGIKTSYFRRMDDHFFEVNSFVFKILLDLFDGSRTYSLKEIHSILKRVFSSECKTWSRTTISFKDNVELVISNNNKSSASVYQIRFQFSDFLKENPDLDDVLLGGSKMIRKDFFKKKISTLFGKCTDESKKELF